MESFPECLPDPWQSECAVRGMGRIPVIISDGDFSGSSYPDLLCAHTEKQEKTMDGDMLLCRTMGSDAVPDRISRILAGGTFLAQYDPHALERIA